jgi:LysR family transcriptional regulator, transcriptional activator of the cysJI operon
MNLESLEYLIKVSEIKSISKAAESMHITQPALTQIIQKMESDLSCELFVRSNKGVVLTDCGHLVYDYAKEIVESYQSMKNRLNCLSNGCMNVVIKTCYSLNNNTLPNILFKIQNEFKNIKLDVLSEGKDKILRDLSCGICDIGMVMCEIESPSQLDVVYCGIEKVVLVASPEYFISDLIEIDELYKHRIIDFTLGSYTLKINEWLNNYSRVEKIQPYFSLDSIAGIKSLVQSQFGLAFLPYSSVKSELSNKSLKEVKLQNFSSNFEIKVLSKSDHLLSPLVKKVKKNLIQIVKEQFN